MGKTIILEGRYDLATSKVVKDIMTVIKRTKGYPAGDLVMVNLPHDLEGTEEYVMEKAGISFDVKVYVVRDFYTPESGGSTINIDDWTIDSFRIDDEDTLEFRVGINSNNEPQVYSKIYMKLQEDVRHEMEHLLQDWAVGDRPSPIPETGEESTYEHHSKLDEVPAMVQGYYRRAKLERRPLDELMTDDLDNEIEKGNLNKEEAEELLRIWILYAKRRLPEAIYSQD
jgi:hypothetical protein